MADPPVPPPDIPTDPTPPVPAPQLPPAPVPGQPTAPQAHVGYQLNWSHFRPEFSGKAEEDAEAHLLCTNDSMNMHNFPGNVKVQRFCLTLVGEARLWYESLRPIANDWQALQEQFRQQYSKIGNTREHCFMHGDHSIMMKIQKRLMPM